ncbi:MAG: DUF177 domain-containing protein [Actinomycetota bacterium]
MSDDAPTETSPSRRGDRRRGRCQVNVADLRRRLGQRREVEIDLLFDEQVVVGSRTLPEPVVGTVTIESIERGVSALGSVAFAWAGECRRCLEPVEGRIDVTIDEIFQVGAPDDSEIIDFDGDNIDLGPVIRDAVALSLPLAPLCRPDCAGPDPDRYPALTAEEFEAQEDAAAPDRDPRWSALDQLDLN